MHVPCERKVNGGLFAEAQLAPQVTTELPSNLISPPSSMNSGGFGTRCSKAQSLDETKLFPPDGVFSRAACRTLFPHTGLAEARRYGEGGWATNLRPQYVHEWCEANHRDYWRRNFAGQIHLLAKTRFHLTSHLLFTMPLSGTKYLCVGKSCCQIEVRWI
jgi:hypothetical protein